MCGRYLIELSEEEMSGIAAAAEKNAGHSNKLSFTFSGGEIFPGNIAPVITANNEVRFMTWGIQGVIAKGRPYINARSETAATSGTFGSAISSRRCLVPASAYFEWVTHDKKHKTKYKFTLPDKSTMYMAGIYSGDGRFAILTRDAAPEITEIHNRMPVIIPKTYIESWLGGSTDIEALTNLQFVPLSNNNPKQESLF